MKLWVFWLLTIGFRLGIWLLLTSDTSQFNLFVGLLLAVALPRSRAIAVAPGLVLGLVWKVIMALPEAYGRRFRCSADTMAVNGWRSCRAPAPAPRWWCFWRCF